MTFKPIQTLFILFFLVISANTFAVTQKTPLSADNAFELSTEVVRPNEIRVKWHIAPGYYLYRERLRIDVEPKASIKNNIDVQFPKAEMKHDIDRGQYGVYSGNLIVPVLLHTQEAPSQLIPSKLIIDYQGCSRDGFCYPPMHKTIVLNAGNQVNDQKNDISFQTLLKNQYHVQSLFNTHHLGTMLLIFTGLGLLLAFTPCVWPMIPILTGIIVGQKQSVSTKKAFLLSATYVLGSAIAYAIAGIIAASMGSSVQAWLQQPWMIAATSALFVLLAFSMFGWFEFRVPQSWQNKMTAWSQRQQGGTYAGVFVMGTLSTLIVSPCVTAPLVGVLMYIGQSGNLTLGASALFMMGIGMGIPLLFIGTSAGKWLPKSGPWMGTVKILFGILMLCMAAWLSLRIVSPTVAAGNRTFTIVHDIASLNTQLSAAQVAHRPVLLDFYADWCESCVSMDRHVFNVTDVKKNLSHYVLLRADLSANSSDDEALLKYLQVVAPPTVLFFTAEGRELNSERIVGEVNATEFLTRLNEITLKNREPS